jgi:sugar phosphate isomerase/epimerase
MNGTRRGFGKLAMVGLSGMIGIAGIAEVEPSAEAQSAGRPNRSLIHGVQFGLQPFCYHDLAMNTQNRPELVRRLVQNGMGMVELHATWCEPRFNDPDVSPEVARKKLRDWRVSAPADYYRKIKKEFDDAGITIFTYYVNISEEDTDAEIDATYEAAEILGAKGAVGSYGLAIARRLVPFPAKHGIFAGLHNHDNLSDPDAFSNEASIEKGLAYSPDFKATLDVRHFTAGNGDCLGFLERHHDRVSSVHLGDRRKNNGRSTPFGEGDAPIVEILRLIRDNQWPIVALLEFEHGTLRKEVDEVQLMFDYCKRALA